MARKKLYYIGRRDNPQFNKPYYVEYGQLTKTEVKAKEKSLYGSMTLQAYESELEYLNEVAVLKADGFRVTK